MDDPRRHWPRCLADHSELRDRLLAMYAAPGRGYHDVLHLTEVLQRIEELIGTLDVPPDQDAVVLAAWFHDAVYRGEADDEERSAELAERELTAAGAPSALLHEAARLVRLTATHRPAEDDLAGQVLCDADLAILAADESRYREYVDGVRAEYATIGDERFRAGRSAVLQDLVAKPSLFHTTFAVRHWEKAARDNIARELGELSDLSG